MARARMVAVLNAAIRMAWVMSLVWVSRSASAARRLLVSVSWSVLVISTDIPGGGATASSRAASVAARARSYRARAARTFWWAFFLAGLGTIRVGSSSVVAYASWESRSKCIRAYRK